MTRVTIKSIGPNPNAIEVSIDGHIVPGIESYQLRHSANDGLPVIELRILARALDIELPDVVLKALDTSPRIDEFARAPMYGTGLDEALAKTGWAIAPERVIQLAARFGRLPIAVQLAVMRYLHLADADEVAYAEGDGKIAAFITSAAFVRAVRLNIVDKFEAAVTAATRGVDESLATERDVIVPPNIEIQYAAALAMKRRTEGTTHGTMPEGAHEHG